MSFGDKLVIILEAVSHFSKSSSPYFLFSPASEHVLSVSLCTWSPLLSVSISVSPLVGVSLLSVSHFPFFFLSASFYVFLSRLLSAPLSVLFPSSSLVLPSWVHTQI